jgi:putative endonuclease
MKAWLYILKCADGSYYTGSTNNLPLRIAQHQAGEGSDYTRRRLPVEVVYTQEFPSEHEAFVRERQVKGWSRPRKRRSSGAILGRWSSYLNLGLCLLQAVVTLSLAVVTLSLAVVTLGLTVVTLSLAVVTLSLAVVTLSLSKGDGLGKVVLDSGPHPSTGSGC